MIRASWCAVAVIAVGARSLARIRRKKAPSTDGLRDRLWAARRKACATRCFTWRVWTESTFPPEMRLSGQTPSPEGQWASVGGGAARGAEAPEPGLDLAVTSPDPALGMGLGAQRLPEGEQVLRPIVPD